MLCNVSSLSLSPSVSNICLSLYYRVHKRIYEFRRSLTTNTKQTSNGRTLAINTHLTLEIERERERPNEEVRRCEEDCRCNEDCRCREATTTETTPRLRAGQNGQPAVGLCFQHRKHSMTMPILEIMIMMLMMLIMPMMPISRQ